MGLALLQRIAQAWFEVKCIAFMPSIGIEAKRLL